MPTTFYLVIVFTFPTLVIGTILTLFTESKTLGFSLLGYSTVTSWSVFILYRIKYIISDKKFKKWEKENGYRSK